MRKKLVKKAKENPKTAVLTALASILSVAAIIGYNSGAFGKKPEPQPQALKPNPPPLSPHPPRSHPLPPPPSHVKVDAEEGLSWIKYTLENDLLPRRYFYSLSGGGDAPAVIKRKFESITLIEPSGVYIEDRQQKATPFGETWFNKMWKTAMEREYPGTLVRMIPRPKRWNQVEYIYTNVEAAFQSSKLFCVPPDLRNPLHSGDPAIKKKAEENDTQKSLLGSRWFDNKEGRVKLLEAMSNLGGPGSFKLSQSLFSEWESAVQKAGECPEKYSLCKQPDSVVPTLYNGNGRWTTMYLLLDQKFRQGTSEHEWLMNTGTSFLLEHNPFTHRDAVWSDKNDGKGVNWLGLQLMLIREKYRPGSPIRKWLFKCFGGSLRASFEDSLENQWTLQGRRENAEERLPHLKTLADDYWQGMGNHGSGVIRWLPNTRNTGDCADYGHPGIQSGIWGAVVRQAARSVNSNIKYDETAELKKHVGAEASLYASYSFDRDVVDELGYYSKTWRHPWPSFDDIPFKQIIAFYGDPKSETYWDEYCRCDYLGNFWTTSQRQPPRS